VRGAARGVADGPICGNRLAALPAGTLIVPPAGPEPMTGSAPTGTATPRPLTAAEPPKTRPPEDGSPTGESPKTSPPEDEPPEEETPEDGPLAVEPAEPPAGEPPEEDPPVVEPAEAPADDFLLGVGLGDTGAPATVTGGALPVAVSGEPLPPATETVAANPIVSPAGAVVGTWTCTPTCPAADCAVARASSKLPLPGWHVQLPAVNTGGLNAGVFALGVSIVVTVPCSAEADRAEIQYRTVPPAGTLATEAKTVTAGFVGLGVPVLVAVGVGVAEDEPDGEADGAGEDWCRWPPPRPGDEAPGLPVPPAAGAVGPVVAGLDAAGLDAAVVGDDVTGPDGSGLDGAAGKDGAGLEDGEVDDAPGWPDTGVLADAVGDGVAEADGAMPRTKTVTPLKLASRPVAMTSVVGRARLTRITPRHSMP